MTKTKFLVGLVLILAFFAQGIDDAPKADAHVSNPYAAWACGASRPSSTWITTHAVPTDLTPEVVEVYCRAKWLDGSHDTQWWALLWWNGEVTHWPYAYCYLDDFCSPEPS